jgi:hypothetical protein
LAALVERVEACVPPAAEIHGEQLEALADAFEARAIPVAASAAPRRGP